MRAEVRIAIPPEPQALLTRLHAAGYAAYVVGGCVRDSLLGRQPQDWDLCTSALPEQTAACFTGLRTILTGARYGTVTVLLEGAAYEITTFRAESGYSDSRHPDAVRYLSRLEGDLARRDFTVNAMAADASGVVTDCFGGMEDLRLGRIRCVGVPEARFSEDALRILRALRFASKLGFSVDGETAAAIHAGRERLRAVAPERLRKELSGLLCGAGAGTVLRDFADVLDVLLPELTPCRGFWQYNPHHTADVWQHTVATVEAVEPVETLRLAALLHDIGKPGTFSLDKRLVGHFYGHAITGAAMASRALRRLRFDNETVRRVATLVREHSATVTGTEERAMRRFLARVGEETARDVLRLRRADLLATGTRQPDAVECLTRKSEALLEAVLREKQCFSLAQLALRGGDLLALGVREGPELGRMLQCLLDAVVEGRVPNEHAILVEYAQKNILNSEND